MKRDAACICRWRKLCDEAGEQQHESGERDTAAADSRAGSYSPFFQDEVLFSIHSRGKGSVNARSVAMNRSSTVTSRWHCEQRQRALYYAIYLNNSTIHRAITTRVLLSGRRQTLQVLNASSGGKARSRQPCDPRTLAEILDRVDAIRATGLRLIVSKAENPLENVARMP